MPTTSDTLTTLASGTVTAPGTGTWQHLALTFNGSSISAAINGTTVASVTDATYASGMAGFGTTGYQTDQFDNLSVTLAGSATPTGHIITVTTPQNVPTSTGARLRTARRCRCGDATAMRPRRAGPLESNGTVGINGKCLDITGGSTANGALIEEWTCNGGSNQQWSVP